MKKHLRWLVLVMAWAALPALAQTFTFDYPRQWKLESIPDQKNKAAAPTAHFTSATDRIEAQVSILDGRDASGLTPDQLRDMVQSMVADGLDKSVEGTARAVAFGPNDAGMYVRLTSKNDKSASKYLTTAVFRSGKDLALGQLTSSDDDGAMLALFLGIMKSVAGAPTPATGATTIKGGVKGAAPSADEDLWGAIAVAVVPGDVAPFFGVGGGTTQAEAEKNAQGFCREAGGKRCQVQLAYRQCGAYAVSVSGSGTGIGKTQKAAEQKALSACGDKCGIVASDCN